MSESESDRRFQFPFPGRVDPLVFCFSPHPPPHSILQPTPFPTLHLPPPPLPNLPPTSSDSARDSARASLKLELKAWENQFRRTHNGTDPTKQDIKNDIAIAAKYKLYQKLKTQPNPTTTTASSSSNTSKRSPTTSTFPTTSGETLFQTPQKPRPSTTTPSSITPQRNQSTRPATPNLSFAPITTTTTNSNHPNYVHAHSPNKMRDLAASFSPRRSPNHRQSQSKKETTFAQDLFAQTKLESPRKYNPFAREGTTASPTKRIKLSGGEEAFKRSNVRLGQLFGAARRKSGGLVEDDDDEDQEMLGESPVKNDATKRKSFVPLFDHDEDEEHEASMKNPFLASGADGKRNGKRKKKEDDEPGKKGGAMDGWLRKAVHPTLKAVKRTGYEGAELVEDDEDEDGGDKGEGGSAGTNGQKGKKKPKRAPAGLRYKKIPGGKAPPKKGSTTMAVDSDDGDSDEAVSDRVGKTSRVGSMLIIDLDDEEQHRIVIRSTGEGVGGAGTSKMEEGEEDELVLATGSLIYARRTPPPSSSIPTTSMDEDAPTWHNQDQANEALPEDLASILSLRSSPMKKTASKRMLARDRTVDDLLKGPSAGVNRVKKGLMDLEDEETDKVGEEGVGSDDDWASDVEGWKAVSDGEMDGYEEVEALGRM